jgi:CheY-like chemotaxis protein
VRHVMNDSRTILLADDSEDDLYLLRKAFEKAEFHIPLQEVRNGEEAIAYLKGDGAYGDRDKYPVPVVMLLDLNMPRQTGFDVLGWVRAHSTLKRMSIVVLTASMRMEDVERAFDLGAHSFLVKPSNLEGMVNMIRCLRDWIQINHFPPLNEAVKR